MFDDPLFVRHGHAMTPTPLARRLVEPIRRALRGLEVTLSKAESFEAVTAVKRFTVGMRDVVESVLLPRLMRTIAATAPSIDISVVRAERRELERELSVGTLDAAIDVLLPLPEEIRRERLGQEWMTVVARRRHPRVRSKLDLDAYLAQEHILVSSRRRGLNSAATICADACVFAARATSRPAAW
jgi:DNA-binding transcriptional LysR family regulator